MSQVPSPKIEALIRGFSDMPGGLLPALHAIQHELGYVDRNCIALLADVFNQTVAEVHGVITYYQDFRTEAPSGPVVHVCRAEACQSRGGRAVWDRAKQAALNKAVELEEVFCLGHCALGPAAAIQGKLYGDVTPDGIALLLAGASEPHAPRPQTESGGVGVTVFVPRDAASRAAGADEVAAALAVQKGIRVIRNGSWGMLWLEPMIEVQTPNGRIAYGPVQSGDVKSLLEAGLLEGGDHPLRLGPTNELPWMKRQQRFTFERVGLVDPRSPEDYEQNGGVAGLRRALGMSNRHKMAHGVGGGRRKEVHRLQRR